MGDSADTAREKQAAKRVPKKKKPVLGPPVPIFKPDADARSFGAHTAIFVPPELQHEAGPKPKPVPRSSVVLKIPKRTESTSEKRKRLARETHARERLRLGKHISSATGENDTRAVPDYIPHRSTVSILGGHGRMWKPAHDIALGLGLAGKAAAIKGAKGIESWAGEVADVPGNTLRALLDQSPAGPRGVPQGLAKAGRVVGKTEPVVRPVGSTAKFVGSEKGQEEIWGKSLVNLALHGDTPGNKMEAAGLGVGVLGILPLGKITQLAKLGKAARAAGKIGEALEMTPARQAAYAALAQRYGVDQADDLILMTDNIARQAAASKAEEVGHIAEPDDWYKHNPIRAGNYADFQATPGAKTQFQTEPGERFGLVKGTSTDKVVEEKLRLSPQVAHAAVEYGDTVHFSHADEMGLLFTNTIKKVGHDKFVIDSLNGGPPKTVNQEEAKQILRTAEGRWTMEQTTTPGAPDTPVFYAALPEKVNQQMPKQGMPRAKLEQQLRGKPDKQGNFTGDIKDAEWEESGMPAFLDQYGPNEIVPKADLQRHLASPLNAYDIDEVIFSSADETGEFASHWHTYPSHSPGAMVVRTPTPSEPYYEIRMTLRKPIHTRVKKGLMSDRIEPAPYGSKGQIHWGTDDVIAHVRFHIITDNHGKKALLVDEIQSDWASQWREVQKAGGKEGMERRAEEIKDKMHILNRELEDVGDGGPRWADQQDMQDELAELHDELEQIRSIQQGVPGPPPLGQKQVEAIVRRTLRFAEEAKVDRIIIVQGDVQAIRNMALGKTPKGKWINVHSKDRATQQQSLSDWRAEMGELTQEELKAYANDPANWEGGIAETFFDVYGKRLPKTFEKEMGEKGQVIEGVFNGGFADETGTVRRAHQGRRYQMFHGVEYKEGDIPAVEGDVVGTPHGIGKLVKDGNGSLGPENGGLYRPVSIEMQDGTIYQTVYADVFKMVPSTRKATGETPMAGYVIEMTDGAKAKARIPKPLYQQRAWEAIPKGATEFFADGTRAIHLFENADISTIIHELAHVGLEDMSAVDRAIIMRHFNGLRTTADHEMYARSFERYIYEGHAMASPLDGVFAKLKTYMQGIYQHVNNIGGVANPEVKQVFDRMVVQQEAPEQQLVRMLKEAPPVRRAQEAGYSEERGKRIADMFEQWDREGGKDSFHAAISSLKGELPKEEFTALDDLTPEAVDHIVNAIRNSNRVRPYQKVRAASAIIKATEGSVPTKSELELLDRIFGKEVGFKKVRKNGIDQILVEIINIPRSLSASIDLSAPLRQGLVAGARHPIIFKRNFMPMVKALRVKNYEAQTEQIVMRPNFERYQRAKLAVETHASDPAFANREEAFYSSYADKIPGVKHSSNAYSSFLHNMRADVFDHMIATAQAKNIKRAAKGKKLIDVDSPEFLEALGRYVNTITGRGALPNTELLPIEKMAPGLNTLFFSPRLLASRINMISPFYYGKLWRQDPFVAKQAMRAMVHTVSGAVAALVIADQIPGVDVSLNPTSANFGKVRIGDTRIDMLAGFNPLMVFIARETLGYSTSSTTGKRQDLKGGFGESSRKDILYRFGESKLAPSAGILRDVLGGQTFIGDPVTLESEALNFLPMMWRDAWEVGHESNDPTVGAAAAAAVVVLGGLGIGFSSYPDKKPKSRKSSKVDKDDPYAPALGPTGADDPYAPVSGGSAGEDPYAPS